jgi:hypothetical protein
MFSFICGICIFYLKRHEKEERQLFGKGRLPTEVRRGNSKRE